MIVDNKYEFQIEKYTNNIENIDPIKYTGRVIKVDGLKIISRGPVVVIGEVCKIILSTGKEINAEVIGIEEDQVYLSSYDEMEGVEIGAEVVASGELLSVYVGDQLLGRVIDGIGNPYDDFGTIGSPVKYPAFNLPSDAMKRKVITDPFVTGVKAIDSLLTIGKGQRIGIFAGSGVGKSTLLGMIARNISADVNVIALIGERSRELLNFIHNDLGEEGLKKSVIIFASSNKSALSRVRGAYIATAIAEYFRDEGKDVVLMMDSVTRFAQAQKEIGLAAGEPPASRGYPPSVQMLLPKLMERAGTGEIGSITGIYTVLVEGDDMDEPVADWTRGILDGHIVLDRKLAHKNHYPAIDVLSSISRLALKITDPDQQEKAGLLRELIAAYKENEDLISVGAYAAGSNPTVDLAIAFKNSIDSFLRQRIEESYTMEQTLQALTQLIDEVMGNVQNEEEDEEFLFY